MRRSRARYKQIFVSFIYYRLYISYIEVFKTTPYPNMYMVKYIMGLEQMVTKYVITTAQYGAAVNTKFLDTLDVYAKYNDAEVVILPTAGKCVDDDRLHERLQQYKVITKDYALNKNIKLSNYEVKPQQIDPTTGLGRFAQDDTSTIFASTKQRMKVIPNSNTELPKVIMTTGAVTKPRYRDNRIGNIAKKDHMYGAIVVETKGNKLYQFRNISANVNGVFYDLDMKYTPEGTVTKERPEALVCGDWHVGDTNKKVKEATYDMITDLEPRRVVLHDFFNGHSINHHEEGKLLDKVASYKENNLNLEKELKLAASELDDMCLVASNSDVYLVRSNHDEFLDRYLSEGRFLREPQNAYIASKLLTKALEGENPLKAGMEETYSGVPQNAYFLSRDEDLKVRGFQLGNHGDLGSNGARGSLRSTEWANGKSIVGHKHTPEIFRNIYVVGTSTDTKLRYTKGFSSWMNTHAVLYENGKVQMVNIIDGKYKF